jgi:hypothetical protein
VPQNDDDARGCCHWIVEYWSREEYINMDTHADIDEQLLLTEGLLQCPEYAHVLYLEVDPNLRGPTCISSKEKGWYKNPPTTMSDNKTTWATTSLITVPAVSGRLLQFPGASMHAVPKPLSLWFSEDEMTKQQQADDETETETPLLLAVVENDEADKNNNDLDSDWDDSDDDDHDDAEQQRCVILFNLWRRDDRGGPRGKTEDLMEKGSLPEGIGYTGDDQDNNKYIEQERQRRVTQWNQDYGLKCRDLWCNPRNLWNTTAIVVVDNDNNTQQKNPTTTTIRVPLMGNKARRLHHQRHVRLSSPASLASALHETTTPRHFTLHEE